MGDEVAGDQVLEEVRKLRGQHAVRLNYDTDAIFDGLLTGGDRINSIHLLDLRHGCL
jgi:hypothetical protein